MNKRLCFLFIAVTAVPVALLGQEKSQAPTAPPANPITASEKGLYSFVSNAVIGVAQKMPEENYSFKPTRTFAVLANWWAMWPTLPTCSARKHWVDRIQ